MLVFLVVLVYGQAHVNLTLPDYMSKIINDGVAKKDMDAVWENGRIMLLWTLFGGVCTVIIGFLAARISTGYVRRLREAVFTKVEQFSLTEFNSFSSSSLVTRATNDLQQIQMVTAMILRMAFLAPIMGIGSIVRAYDIAPSMTWIVYAAIGVIVTMVSVMFFVVIPKFKIIQQLVDKLSLQMKEMLTGVRVIRAYNNDELQEAKFDAVNTESFKINVFVNRVMMMLMPIMTMVMGLTSVAVVWVGSYAIKNGDIQVGNLFALMQYIVQTIMAFLLISMIFIMVPRAAVSFRRVSEVLKTEPAIKDSSSPTRLPKKIKGIVEFKDVNFGYKGSEHNVLENVSFTAEPGQTTAIIGSTGSGKSTILNLIPRLYDVTDGVITIDGIDIRDISQHDLRQHIGYISQKAMLFSGTVASNIAYGNPDADEPEINKAAKIAQAKEFIDSLPKKMDSPVAQAGSNLSGGQKQRLSIARALAKKPEIYLFDDSFSALDFKTDAALRRELNDRIADATLIIVAQRISTIMQADKIIVLDKGKVVGIGKHLELLKTSSVYKEIAESQLSAKELGEDE